MKNFKTNIKQKYNMSNYQVEQIVFVFKSVGSELSKMLIMGILFQNEILLFLISVNRYVPFKKFFRRFPFLFLLELPTCFCIIYEQSCFYFS